MSHELYSNDDMVYVGAAPWHGLGESVDSIDSLPRCLDWQVCKLGMSFRFESQGERFEFDSQYKALVRSDNHAELGIATDQYEPHQNAKLWETFKSFCDAGNMKIETAGTLRGGKIVWIFAKIDRGFSINGDKQELYALIATAHDRSMVTSIKPTYIRVVCYNTLSAALTSLEGAFKQSHRSDFNGKRAKDFVAHSILGFEDYQKQVITLTAIDLTSINRPISEAYATELVNTDLFNSAASAITHTDITKEMDAMARKQFVRLLTENDSASREFCTLVEKDANRPVKHLLHDIKTEQAGIANKTAWGMFNGVTRYIDHTHGRNADNRLSNAWFGTGAAVKSKGMALALDYADALV